MTGVGAAEPDYPWGQLAALFFSPKLGCTLFSGY